MAQIKRLSAELQKVAIEELGEVSSRIPDDLLALKTWIQHQPHLKARTDDQFLIQFLRSSKYSLEKAKTKLDYYYAFKTKLFPYFGRNIDVDNAQFRDILQMSCWSTLPTPLNGCGPRISLFRFNYPTDKYSIEDMLEVSHALNNMLMINDPYACIYGMVYVTDLAQMTINHILQAAPAFVKRLAEFYLKSMPFRIKAMYYINVPTAALKIGEIILPLLPEKLRKRIYICGKNMESFEAHFPLQYMPKDYGGENGCLQQINDDMTRMLQENREYFKQNLEYGTDESLRPGSPIDFGDDLFGVCGSFRKLDVD